MKIRDSKGRWVKVCSTCVRELTAGVPMADLPAAEARIAEDDRYRWNGSDRYSCGAYAGHYCDRHWQQAGYIDGPNVVGGTSEDEIEAWLEGDA